jgi:hypothetical protein
VGVQGGSIHSTVSGIGNDLSLDVRTFRKLHVPHDVGHIGEIARGGILQEKFDAVVGES